MTSTTLILIRHGVTEWNAAGRIQGDADVELSDEGRAQAARAADAWAPDMIDAFYSSDLSRAMETVQTIAARHDMPVHPAPLFREIHCGSWAGKTWKEVLAQVPEIRGKFDSGEDFRRSPEGETTAEMVARGRAGVEELVAAHPGQTIMVGSHGFFMRHVTEDLLGMDPLSTVLGPVLNTAAVTLIFRDGQPQLGAYNVVR